MFEIFVGIDTNGEAVTRPMTTQERAEFTALVEAGQ